MKIAIVIDGLAKGGAEKQAVLSAIALMRLGHDAHLITCSEINDFLKSIEANKIPLHIITDNYLFKLGRVISLTKILAAENFDVVHCFKSGPSSYGRVAAKLARVPRIFGGVRVNMPDRLSLRLLNRLINISMAKWIANSESCKQSVANDLNVVPDNVFVVPNGIDLSDFQSTLTVGDAKNKFGFKKDIPVITILANLRPEKNHQMFLRVARKLTDCGHGASFVVAGDGPRREKLEQMSRSMELQDYVFFLGQCNDIAALLRATDIFVLTSYFEGTPNALIEAGAAGLPCVTCAAGGVTEVVLNNITGIIVPIDDDDAMVEKITKLLLDSTLRAQMGAAAKEHVTEKFSMAALGNNLIVAYTRHKHEKSNQQAVQN